MTGPANGHDTLLDLTDQDGNRLHIVDIGRHVLLLDVTDENEIPVGAFLDKASAHEVRDALTRWIEAH